MRVPTVLTALVVMAGIATAAPKRKVTIQTDPPGATVYLNAKEDGPVCTTPCTIRVATGDTPIIVELEGHKQLFENLSVAKKPVTVKYKLERAIGTLNVKGPAGAQVSVDDVDKGTAPTKFDIDAGPHAVTLTLDGKTETKFVSVPANEEVLVEGKLKAVADATPDPDPDPDDDENGGGGGGTTDVTTTTSIDAPARRDPYIKAAVAMDVGFRDFTYDNAQTANLTPEKEGGQVLVGPVVEVYPGTLIGVRALRGLSLLVRFGYGVNSQPVKQKVSMSTTSAKTFWRAFEASVRHRWTIKDAVTLELGGGFVRDQYQFEGMVQDIDLVPDADYQSMRLGLRVSALVGKLEPYGTFENRFVLSGGTIEKRFDSANANGFRGALGVEAKFGAFGLRVEGALNRYSWTFKSNESTDKYRADGGTDSIKLITAAFGYTY